MVAKKLQLGSLILHNQESAILEFNRAKKNGLVIVGVDAFTLVGAGVQPHMEHSIDLSGVESCQGAADLARYHVNQVGDRYWFEVTYE